MKFWNSKQNKADKPDTSKAKTFDILDLDTWHHASDTKALIWNGVCIYNEEGRANTEYEYVALFQAMFNFLERDGKEFPIEKKKQGITNVLNRMENPEYYRKLDARREAEQESKIPDGLFNPRDPETYKYAKNKPLVIDGVRIFHTFYESGKKIHEDETEKSFVRVTSALLNGTPRSRLWEKALELTKAEFEKQGVKNPENLPNYIERANEIFESILKNDDPKSEENQKYAKDYLVKHINQKVAECAPKKTTRYGGYDFSEAQMEVLGGCPIKTLKELGKILATNKPNGKLKQEVFNAFGTDIDGDTVVSLCGNASYPNIEERVMYDYYISYELSSEKEVYDFFNSRPYLKNRPELKQEVIKTALQYLQYSNNEDKE